MELDVRRLRILREVALRGTVTAAAAALGFTPSAISQQLTLLERESGTALLNRAGRRIRLTDAGRVLVARTEPVLAALEEARAALEESSAGINGELRVAASGSVARALAVPVAAAIDAAHPRLRTTVLETEGEESMRELRLGRLDVVISHEYADGQHRPQPDVTRLDLCTDEMLVAAPARRFTPPVDLAALAGETWAAEPEASSCGRATRGACHAAGFAPEVRYVSSDPAVLLAAVRSAGAVVLLPGLALAQPTQGVDILPVAGPGLRRVIFAAHRRGSARRPAVALILAELRTAAGKLSQSAADEQDRVTTR